jgi:hypothetical protein
MKTAHLEGNGRISVIPLGEESVGGEGQKKNAI